MAYARLKRYDLANRTFNEAPERKKNWREIESKSGYTPIKITSKKSVSRTELARKNRVSGVVVVAAEFNKNGRVTFVHPIKKMPYGMTEKMIETVRRFEFEPATRNGKNITDILIIQFNFRY